MSPQAEVWVLHKTQTVLCQESGLGVPAAAIVSSDGTLGGTRFAAESLLGPFDLPGDLSGWGEAGQRAAAEAKALGYRLEFFAPSLDTFVGDEDDEPPDTMEVPEPESFQGYGHPSAEEVDDARVEDRVGSSWSREDGVEV